MRIVFEGSPEQVIKDMKEYIVRCGLEFESPTAVTQSSDKRIPSEPTAVIQPEYPMPKIVEVTPKKTAVDKELGDACEFCGENFVALKRHLYYCDKNPGKKAPPRKSLVKKYIDGAYDPGSTVKVDPHVVTFGKDGKLYEGAKS